MKTIKDYRRENNELKSKCTRLKVSAQMAHSARILSQEENQELKAALIACVEALNQKINNQPLLEYLIEQFPATRGHIPLRDFCIQQDKAISLPTVQRVMKEGE